MGLPGAWGDTVCGTDLVVGGIALKKAFKVPTTRSFANRVDHSLLQ